MAPRSYLVGLAGFEPTTFGPPDRRANQAAPQPVEVVTLAEAEVSLGITEFIAGSAEIP